jgi:A/G-specific adenine glycosylase
MVSEFMLQQTPVERVRGPWQSWVQRWPTPASLAAATPGEAVRAWGRLGYPRRALRLHQAAQMITSDFNGQVPEDRELLLSLPGVGSYTAAAIASFAYGRREIVLDTNVRRVLARIGLGQAFPDGAPRTREWTLAEELAPRDARGAARWAVASMELGALVCRARNPSVRPARSRRSAPGGRRAIQPGQGCHDAVRRTRGLIGSAGVPCSPYFGPAPTQSKITS